MSKRPLSAELAAFDGSDQTYSAEELGVVAERFKNAVDDALLGNIEDVVVFSHHDNFTSEKPLYTDMTAFLNLDDEACCSLGLGGGKMELSVKRTETNNPQVPDHKKPASVSVAYCDENGLQFNATYSLSRRGLVRRYDEPGGDDYEAYLELERRDRANIAAAIRNGDLGLAINGARLRMDLEVWNQQNRDFETEMRFNNQSIGISEMLWLENVLRQARPAEEDADW